MTVHLAAADISLVVTNFMLFFPTGVLVGSEIKLCSVSENFPAYSSSNNYFAKIMGFRT